MDKKVKVLEGPWERNSFPNGEESTEGVISRRIVTLYRKDGFLCEDINQREYRGDDYFDTSHQRRICRLDD
tara:strand:+ start:49 stop:261 length:213 start_codon:yes stop_codon:yes gene_type:complete